MLICQLSDESLYIFFSKHWEGVHLEVRSCLYSVFIIACWASAYTVYQSTKTVVAHKELNEEKEKERQTVYELSIAFISHTLGVMCQYWD